MDRLIFLLIFVLACGASLAATAKAAPPPRLHPRFDGGWRFHLGDAPDAWQEDFDDTRWRRVDLPHDWSIEDLPPLDTPAAPALSLVPGAWRFKLGDDAAWKDPKFDDTGWQEAHLPAGWKAQLGSAPQNAYGWYRRRIPVPPQMRGKDILLLLGKIDDVDETYVNGVKVGGLGSFPPGYRTTWEAGRRYIVPARLLKSDGSDVVAVRVYNGDGDGGIYAATPSSHRSGPFDAESEGGASQGYTLGGVGWYRKTFTLPASLRGRSIRITFDGVYMNSEVWLNGRRIGQHSYGYTGFHFDLTPYVRFGRERNVLAVRVDASGKTSRWYSGAGIYRHAWLTAADPVHVEPWGVFVTTPEASAGKASVQVRTAVRNDDGDAQSVTLASRLMDARGETVAAGSAEHTVRAGSSHEFDQAMAVLRPKRWSPDSPALYRLVSTVTVKGRVVDEVETPFGIRTFTVDAKNGFVLNGKPLKLRGGCVHHDNGCLGSCAYDRAEERRVALLKAAGFNAIRTSHNPPSPAFLEACDRLGVLVMDEAFDCWKYGKNPQDYGRFFEEWWKKDIASMVLRDRNHPSVVFWSIGNEIPGQNNAEGAQTAAMLADYVRALDPTRPIAQAAFPEDTKKLDPLFAHLDICGYNYMYGKYVEDHERAPNRVIAGTESFPIASFDSWMATIDHSWVIGDFVWTALDYLGEAGLGKTVPQSIPPGYADNRLWTVSNCGDLDLCCFRRPQSYYRGILWGVGSKVACFVEAPGPDGRLERVEGWGWPDERPSWTWPGREGKTLTARVYSRCAQAKLLLNGKDLGTKETNRGTRFTATWEVPYEPGDLVAVGLDASGREVARWPLRTAGEPAFLRLTPDRAVLAADGQDLSFVTVEVLDAKGVLNPNADNPVRFRLTGPGKIVGVGNADPRSEESFQRPRRKAFRGRCLVVIRAGGEPGEIRLKAEAKGLAGAETVIRIGGEGKRTRE